MFVAFSFFFVAQLATIGFRLLHRFMHRCVRASHLCAGGSDLHDSTARTRESTVRDHGQATHDFGYIRTKGVALQVVLLLFAEAFFVRRIVFVLFCHLKIRRGGMIQTGAIFTAQSL